MEPNNLRILMADDDAEDLELIEEAILDVQPNAEVLKFLNGRTTIEFLNASRDSELPCLIILDYNMPEMTGAQVLAYMKTQERYLAIPKIVLSTSNASPHIQECLSHGATEYFVKPDSIKGFHKLATKFVAFCNQG
jgi:CheY-like chemotaxis protein